VKTLPRTLRTAPVGWALVAWGCWGRSTHPALLAWLALDAGERLRLAVAGAPLAPGVAATLIARADAALYAAKRAGRDRVMAG
jgi:hypothetical protein